MGKYVVYYRVSTKQQGKSGLGLEAQKTAVDTFLKSRNGEQVHPPFTEVESGSNGERPELKKAIARCKEIGAILLIAKLDRLSRNVKFIFTLKEELEQAGVSFVACDLPDANTLTLGLMASMAQHENEVRSTRQKAAFAEKRKRGEPMGSPQNLTDEARKKAWQSIKEKARKDEATRHAFHFIKPRREAGQSYQAIAGELNKEGYRTRKGREFFPAQVHKIYMRFTEPLKRGKK